MSAITWANVDPDFVTARPQGVYFSEIFSQNTQIFSHENAIEDICKMAAPFYKQL